MENGGITQIVKDSVSCVEEHSILFLLVVASCSSFVYEKKRHLFIRPDQINLLFHRLPQSDRQLITGPIAANRGR